MPSFGYHLKIIPLEDEANVECKQDDVEKKKPNYLERKPSYFDEEKGGRSTRNKTRAATMFPIGTQYGEIRAP